MDREEAQKLYSLILIAFHDVAWFYMLKTVTRNEDIIIEHQKIARTALGIVIRTLEKEYGFNRLENTYKLREELKKLGKI